MLKYIGNGASIIGIPARDLTDDEVKEHGGVVVLVKTGLYERVEVKPVHTPAGTPKGQKPVKDDKGTKELG